MTTLAYEEHRLFIHNAPGLPPLISILVTDDVKADLRQIVRDLDFQDETDDREARGELGPSPLAR